VSHLGYLLPRLVRRCLPSPIIHVVKRLNIGMVPGLETRDPKAAADRYEVVLQKYGKQWEDKRILILGYGGFFGLGVELLLRGARHVVLVDPFAQTDNIANQRLVEKYRPYLMIDGRQILPNPDWITLVHEEIPSRSFGSHDPIDIFLSSSVLEHVSSLDPLVHELSGMTQPEGFHIHFVDLRDHYFKYPFEMLCFSEAIWRSLLDPPSHLNRLRLWDYKDCFSRNFNNVGVEIIESDPISFNRVKSRIRPEFLCGKDKLDSATRILITAANP
jgi:hypothetical protein